MFYSNSSTSAVDSVAVPAIAPTPTSTNGSVPDCALFIENPTYYHWVPQEDVTSFPNSAGTPTPPPLATTIYTIDAAANYTASTVECGSEAFMSYYHTVFNLPGDIGTYSVNDDCTPVYILSTASPPITV